MTKHVVIEIDPTAQYDWNRVTVRCPFTTSEPDLKEMVKTALANQPGHYLARVSVSVEVLEHYPLQEPEALEREAEIIQEQRDHLADVAA